MTKDSAQLHSPALVFKDFSFRYRSQAEMSLIGINLSVGRGEKILILGPSGSGKSTLAHCINGLIPNAFPGKMTGSLSILGEDAAGLGIFGISKKVGTVLQDTDDQFVGQSAGEDIAFAAENDMVPVEEMRRRVKEAAELVKFEEALTKAPQELSGGQKQRVSMAGVLTDDVEILLFDEPL
ncbi:MAG: energy-coupling factor ABC transporter ATP-binding protein, partial [Treponema sp.]|nr:energy-coupling factor ABC transporter ATP-binding protein [Treponema sp.]